MAGAKTANKEIEQEVPPNEAGREVLSYVQQQEKEADEAFAEAYGGEEADKEVKDDDKKGGEEVEKKTESKEPEKSDNKEAEGEEPEAKDKTAEGDDLTTGLNTENAQKRISSAQKQMHTSNQRAVTAEGERDRLKEENEALQRKLEAAPAAPEVKDTAKAPEKEEPVKVDKDELQTSLDELSQEYPEIAKPMLKMMARQEVENKKLTDQVASLVEKEATRTADAVTEKTNSHYDAISDVHKDFKEISAEPLLDDWIDSLPAIEKAGAQAIRKGGTTSDVIALLTSFKKANGYELPAESKDDTPAKKSNSKIEKAKKAANPSFNKTKDVNMQDGQAEFTRSQIAAMTPAEFAENEPAIDAAMAKGLVH